MKNKGKTYTLSGKTVTVHKQEYRNNGTLAVQVFRNGEPSEVITVNLNSPMQSDVLAFVDENNNPGIGKWLKRNHIAVPMGCSERSGFCTYPLYAFTI